ncbi:hypothetical protein [Aerococcus christensenii]
MCQFSRCRFRRCLFKMCQFRRRYFNPNEYTKYRRAKSL